MSVAELVILFMIAAFILLQLRRELGKKQGDEDSEMTDDNSNLINIRTVEEIAGVIPEDILDRLTQAMQPKKIGSSYGPVSTVITDVVADGWSATQLLIQVCYSFPCQPQPRLRRC